MTGTIDRGALIGPSMARETRHLVIRRCLRELDAARGGMTSNADLTQVSQIELNTLRYQSINFGLSSTRGHKVTTDLALM